MFLTPNSPEFQPVVDALRAFGDEKIVYVPNPGNAGDAFITHATFQFLDRLGIAYETGSNRESYPGRIIAYGAGGALVPYYGQAADFIRRNIGRWRAFVLLPHTVQGHEALLGQLGADCTLICRERMSYDHVRAHAGGAQVLLSHDMALQADLDTTRTAGAKLSLAALQRHGLLRRHLGQAVHAFRRRLKAGGRELSALRQDDEKTGIALPAGNCDLSELFWPADCSAPASLLATRDMLRFLDRFDTVRTNRLHVCILAAKLGKTVLFHANSYGKNRAIYEHSLQPRFPNVIWQEDA